MIVRITAQGFDLTQAIESFVTDQIGTQLDAVRRSVLSVTARVGDINSYRGGPDKLCSLVVRLKRGGTVVVKAVETDLYLAIRRAAKKLRRATVKVLARADRRRRSDPQRPGTLGTELSVPFAAMLNGGGGPGEVSKTS